MVKTIMSTDGSESEQTDSLTKTKDKLKVQQRLIDISARNLQSTRLSSRDFSGSGTVTPGSGVGEGQSAIEENIRLLENKLLKNFSNQLLLKHQCLKQLEDEEEYAAVPLEKVKSELDQLISLEQFLNVTGLEAKSTKALLSDSLTLDSLFLMASSELEQMLVKHDINPDDGRRLMMCLDHLNSFYEMYQRGEKPSVSSYDRLGSTTSSRLGSMGSMDADYRHRTDSSSSTFLNSTTGAQSSSASTTPTPLTPSSSQSLLSPSPFTGGSASGTVTPTQIPTPPPGTNSHGFTPVSGSRGLNRGQSCSTTVLLSDVESPTRRQLSHSHHSTSSLSDPKTSGSGVKLRRSKPALTHKRSLSNPLHNIILDEAHSESQEQNSEYNHQNSNDSYVSSNMSGSGSQYNVYQQQYQQQPHHYPLSHRSPSPPSRAGSQPSVYVNSVGGSPSSIRHPQMRRIAATTPEFSVSIPSDEMMYPTPRSGGYGGHLSGSESILHRQNTWQGGVDEFPPPTRCYSYAGQRKSECTQPVYNEMTSASMVDLPMTAGYALSSEHLDQIEEYPLPSSGKSQSVPRLTLMSIDKGVPSTSAPTSPRTPGIYTPTGHMGHAIMHRFTVKTYKPHICDVCKKTVMMGVKCKHCKYRVHKACAERAPHNCGLPRELIDYFRKQVVLTSALSPSNESFVSPSEGHSVRPPLQKVSTISEPDCGKENDQFVIHELSKEPSKTQFSPIMGVKRQHHENGRRRYELSSQTSSTSLLEVPHPHLRSGYRSTSSSPSPSTSPPTSPSLTPSSPRSPNEYGGGGMMGGGGHNYSRYQYPNHSSPTKEYIRVVFTDESGDESCDDRITSDSSAFSSKNSSTNDISDLDRVRAVSPTGLRPPPQVVAAHSLPDLLNISSTADHMDSGGKFVSSTISNGYVSDESYTLGGSVPKIRRKESIQRTLSTADSKTSTLVNSLPTEEDDYDADSLLSSQGDVGESFRQGARVMHRNSIVDEWSIPYKSIKIHELVGRGPVGEVYRGYWHGEVAIKRFSMPDASPDQINRFKEEVAILKKTRHENLALFMGASLTAPDLAIVTSFCKGRTLYKYLHVWCEPFALEKSINIGRQVAQAMGYLHARGIVHKDLNTKNIFLEKDKVIITDTGLSSLSDNIWIHRPQVECKKGYVVIPRTKLYYLAPEILRVLGPCPEVLDVGGDLYPYSEWTDVFAFGTVMYELLSRKFPFMMDIFGFSMDPSVVVYLVGSGRRPDMQSREIPKRVKDLVLQCWHQEPRQRLPFSTINEVLIKLSRKKTPISRSPSFPISLSRSSESLNFLK